MITVASDRVALLDEGRIQFEGTPDRDAAAEIAKTQYAGTAEYAGDYPAIVPLMMAGEATLVRLRY